MYESSFYRGSTLFPEYGLNRIFDELHNGVWESRTHQEESYYLREISRGSRKGRPKKIAASERKED
jgi:hypothetical protein